MPEQGQAGISAVQVKRIKLAVGCICERCRRMFRLPLLEIHYIREHCRLGGRRTENVEENLIVLCSACHQKVHATSHAERELAALRSARPASVRGAIRTILSQQSRTIHPPADIDLAEVFREALEVGGIDLFLNGA
ncbi:HNH endonuclease [Methanoculleus sp.]|uniref:HNH endonuclease n=1 Tax=Methanoculleus sp. TaxID=90427 RepID=UPI00272EDA7D|nr:HNH endonuclease [Methanoculleus sp.]